MDFYAVQRPVGEINDIPELRNKFIKIFDKKTKNEAAKFGLLLAEHLHNISGYKLNSDILNAFSAVQKWIDGETNYYKARTLAGAINDLAKNEEDKTKVKYYRAMAQISCIPHVKFHALWACDYIIALINRLYPNDLDAVKKERNMHIKLMQKV